MPRWFAAPFALCLSLAAASTSAAQLTPLEQAVVASVRSENPRALALLKETVDINSGTMNFAGVRRVGEVMDREFRDIGMRTEWIDGSGFQRAGHLVAHHDGAPGSPKVLLIGHLDTVFAKDSPFQALQLTGPKAGSGPGVNDMKGGNVILLQALRALKANGQLDRLSVRVVLTGDEEDSGKPTALSKQALLEAGDWADVAIGFENADGRPENAAVSRRGASGWQLQVTGQPAHSSQIFQPEVGAGAIYEAARILEAFRDRLSGFENLSFNPGVIVGGTDVALDHEDSRGSAFGKDNVVAQKVLVDGDTARTAGGGTRDHARNHCHPAAENRRDDRVRRRLSADGTDARQPRLAGPVRRRQPRPRPGTGGRRASAQGRRRRHQLRRRSRGHGDRRARAQGPGQPHRG